MSVRIIIGDVRDKLAELPDESVHCVVTSPPYWGLRDYGVTGQIGLEADFRDYIATMVEVFRAVRRVLRPDGTLWLNLGDSYCTTPRGNRRGDLSTSSLTNPQRQDKLWGKHKYRDQDREPRLSRSAALKHKDLMMMPARIAIALQEEGWWLRQDIIWSKPNPMPESVTDRCTKAHEYIFLLSKSERYWFDAAAIAEAANSFGRQHTSGEQPPKVQALKESGHHGAGGDLSINYEREIRNKRSVWAVASEPFPDAHFATFPPALIEPCILAGCPKGETVLDPFGGAGTTGLVADRLGRNAILVELNPDYAEMAKRRIERDAGLFAEVA